MRQHCRLLASATVTIPALYYLYNSGPPETKHGGGPHRPVVGDHGAAPSDENGEDLAEKAQKEAAPAKQAAGQQADTAAEGEKPSDFDLVRMNTVSYEYTQRNNAWN